MSAFAFVHRANVHICFYSSEQPLHARKGCLVARCDKILPNATDTEQNRDDLEMTARDDDVACVPWDDGVVARFSVPLQIIADQLPLWDVPRDVFPVEDVHAWVELFSFLEEDANAVSARLLRTLCVSPAQFPVHAANVCLPYGYRPRKHALSSFDACLSFVDMVARLMPSLWGTRDTKGLSLRTTALAQRLGWRESALAEYLPLLDGTNECIGMRGKQSSRDLTAYLPSDNSKLVEDGRIGAGKKLVGQGEVCTHSQWVHAMLSPFCDVVENNGSAGEEGASASMDESEQGQLWHDGRAGLGILRELSENSDILGRMGKEEDATPSVNSDILERMGKEEDATLSENSDVLKRMGKEEDATLSENSDVLERIGKEEEAVTSIRESIGDQCVPNGRTEEEIKDRDILYGQTEKDGYAGTCMRKLASHTIMREQVERYDEGSSAGAMGWIDDSLQCTEPDAATQTAFQEHRAVDGPPEISDIPTRSIRPEYNLQNTDVPFPIPPEFDDAVTEPLTVRGLLSSPDHAYDPPFPRPPILPYKETTCHEPSLVDQHTPPRPRVPKGAPHSKPSSRLQATPCRSAPRLQWSIRGFLAELEQEPLPQKPTVDDHGSASDTRDTGASPSGSAKLPARRSNDESTVHLANEGKVSSSVTFGSPISMSSATSMQGASLRCKAMQLDAISRDNAREISNGSNNAQARAATRRARLRANLYLQKEKMSLKEQHENDLHKRFAHRNERRIREFMARVQED